ncbi:MAG: putative zinc-binding protein [Planctomycetota bacterium]|jgi:uncharacterized metal-binding protein
MTEGGKSKDSECCNGGKNVLIYACSGAANVAEIADRAARELTCEGAGKMFCLAGLGAGIDGMVQTARDADANVVIDGCDTGCGKKIFDRAGVDNYMHIKVTDLGIEKVKGMRATDGQVASVVVQVKNALTER